MIIKQASAAGAETIAEIHGAARQRAMPWLPVLHTPDEVCWYFKTIVLPAETVLIAHKDTKTIGFSSVKNG